MPSSGNDPLHPVKPLKKALQQSHIFGDLSAQLIDSLVATMTTRVIGGGQSVYVKGQESDSMLVVISGRLLASFILPDGSEKRLSEIGPGSSVGEVGLILRQPRSVNVKAIRDTTVAMLSYEQFEQLLLAHPIDFNRAITRTLFEYSRQSKPSNSKLGATTIAVVAIDQHVDIESFCQALKLSFAQHGSVEHISAAEGRQLQAEQDLTVSTNQQLAYFDENFDFVIYQSAGVDEPWSELAIRQADQLILLANFDSQPSALLGQCFGCQGIDMVRKSLVLLHPQSMSLPKVNVKWQENIQLERIYPLRLDNPADVPRLVRFLTGTATGLVLGGGGARGLAHIGVIKALEQANIPIDLVCGNSMGALIGAQYITGTPIDELLAQTTGFIKGGERPSLPMFSLLSGRRVRRDLRRMFTDILIEQLWRPFFAVSCNLSRASIHVHDSGPLWQGVLASNSPAGILPPVIDNGELLVDAALLDNVPVKAMREKLPYGRIIAVDVDVEKELTVSPEIRRISNWQVLWQKLFARHNPKLPDIIDLLMRSGHLGGLAHRKVAKEMADYYLQPPVEQFNLMAYGKGQQIVDVGFEYAQSQISTWNES